MSLLSWQGFGEQKKRRIFCLLVDEAAVLGLPNEDVANVREHLKYSEYECAFDILVQQLYEYSIPITEQYYQQLEASAEAMSLPVEQYVFVKELTK